MRAVGIPFGIRHLKLAGMALASVGKTTVSQGVAAAARRVGKATRPPVWPCKMGRLSWSPF
jgi:uncharacterized membrane protein YccF (DUF307 family)